MTRAACQIWIVLFAAGSVMFLNLGGSRLWDIDEPRNATCAREMMQRGDWVVPTFNEDLRTDKPVLLYWGMITAYHVFGVSEFSARFWSALCAMGTALLTYQMGRRLFSGDVGMWAALLLSAGLMFVVAGRAATPDSVMIFFITLSLFLFVRATFTSRENEGDDYGAPPTRWVDWLGIYSAMGLAVLAKGPVGVLFPTAIIGSYCLYYYTPFRADDMKATGFRRTLLLPLLWFLKTFDPLRIVENAWKMRPILLAVTVLGVALPWYLLVGLRTDWEWTSGFLGTHNLGRFSAPMEGHQGPFYYYLIAMAVGFFPGSVFLMPMLLHVKKQLSDDSRRQQPIVFLTIWIVMFVLVFSFSGTKLPSYISPIYPALALLTGHLLQSVIVSPAAVSRFWFRAAMVCLGLVGCAMLFGLTYAIREFLPGNEYLALVGIIPLVAAVVCLWLFEQGRTPLMARVFVVASLLFSTTLFGWAPTRINAYRENNLIETSSRDFEQLAAYGSFNPSWVFYAGRSITRYTEADEANAYLQQGLNRGLVTTAHHLEQLQEDAPSRYEVVATHPRFLRNGELVVVRVKDVAPLRVADLNEPTQNR